jgi:putative salt-induced outer membrane protein YdiY
MNLLRLSLSTVPLFAAAIAGSRLTADVVETANGARLVGQVVSIEKGVVVLKTDYAGEIKIKQDLVTSIATDHAVAVRLASGSRIEGIVSSPSAGTIQVAGADGTFTTTVPKIAATWAAGQEDPDIVALRRHWTYEADVDIEGKSGNHNQLGTDVGFRATLVGPEDTLQLYTDYNRQVTDGAKSADQFKMGIDYADHFTELASWYLRDESGFDRVMGIRYYDIAAGGLGYDFIHDGDHEVLTGRAGLSYRYDSYLDTATPNLSSLGADFEIEHKLKLGNSYLTNRIAFVPAFQDFGNFVINHESAYEIPLLSRWWKLKIGISNDYQSKPPPGIDKLDTTYFTRLVLNWGL